MIALIDQVTKSASNQSEENSFGSAHQKHKITNLNINSNNGTNHTK